MAFIFMQYQSLPWEIHVARLILTPIYTMVGVSFSFLTFTVFSSEIPFQYLDRIGCKKCIGDKNSLCLAGVHLHQFQNAARGVVFNESSLKGL